jgi:hypothetical protein
MKDLLTLLLHLLTTIANLLGPGGAKAVVADSLLMKQQLLVIKHTRRRAPNLSALDQFLFGFWSLFLEPNRIRRRCRNYPVINAVEVSSPAQATQVSTAVFNWSQSETWLWIPNTHAAFGR